MAGIILVRHAPTAWTGSRYCGRSDPPLDAAGVAVAHRLAGDLPRLWRPARASSRARCAGHMRRRPPSPTLPASTTSPSTIAGARPISGSPKGSHSRSSSASRPTSPAASPTARPRSTGRTANVRPTWRARVAAAWRDLVTAGDEVLVVSHAGPLRIALGLASGRAPGTVDLPGPGAVIRLSMTVPA